MTDFGKLYADEAHKKKVLLEVLSERDAEIERLRREVDLRMAQLDTHVQANIRLDRELAEARGLLIQADQTISELAEQQAMPDQFYMQTLDRIDAFLTTPDQPPAAQEWDESKCTCVYATAENTASVRKGYEMGGYVKETCAYCASFKSSDD